MWCLSLSWMNIKVLIHHLIILVNLILQLLKHLTRVSIFSSTCIQWLTWRLTRYLNFLVVDDLLWRGSSLVLKLLLHLLLHLKLKLEVFKVKVWLLILVELLQSLVGQHLRLWMVLLLGHLGGLVVLNFPLQGLGLDGFVVRSVLGVDWRLNPGANYWFKPIYEW